MKSALAEHAGAGLAHPQTAGKRLHNAGTHHNGGRPRRRGLIRETHRQPPQSCPAKDPLRCGSSDLPADEHVKAFRVLVAVFAFADVRRRQMHCKNGCGHPWHSLPTTPAKAEQP
ncbi:DUF5958 family protein [Streptomyces sp. NPDC046161]|uniref:DUF5958 family protein n=1 Tax=Streptomyces sp. NPDC046161 TaxID=3155132 RepID=UPI003401D648